MTLKIKLYKHLYIFILFVLANIIYRAIVVGSTDLYDADFFDASSLPTNEFLFPKVRLKDLILTDSVLYANFFEDGFIALNVFIIGQGNFAVLGISLIALLIQGQFWHFIMNVMLCIIAANHILKILELINYRSLKPIVIILFYPYTLYYCQSINKEVFLLALFPIFLFALLSNKKLLLISSMLGILLVKFFFVFICIFTVVFHKVDIRKSYLKRLMSLSIFTLFGMFPILSSYVNTGSIQIERAESQGLISKIDGFQNSVPFISYFTFPIKLAMNSMEGFNASGNKLFLIADEGISVVGLVSIVSLSYIIFYFLKYLVIYFASLFDFYLSGSKKTNALLFFTFISTTIILMNSFIHVRYFYFLIPFYVIVGDLFYSEIKQKDNKILLKLSLQSLERTKHIFNFLFIIALAVYNIYFNFFT